MRQCGRHRGGRLLGGFAEHTATIIELTITSESQQYGRGKCLLGLHVKPPPKKNLYQSVHKLP